MYREILLIKRDDEKWYQFVLKKHFALFGGITLKNNCEHQNVI